MDSRLSCRVLSSEAAKMTVPLRRSSGLILCGLDAVRWSLRYIVLACSTMSFSSTSSSAMGAWDAGAHASGGASAPAGGGSAGAARVSGSTFFSDLPGLPGDKNEKRAGRFPWSQPVTAGSWIPWGKPPSYTSYVNCRSRNPPRPRGIGPDPDPAESPSRAQRPRGRLAGNALHFLHGEQARRGWGLYQLLKRRSAPCHSTSRRF